MKKVLALCLVLCFVLGACGSGISAENRADVKRAVEIADDFIDGKIDGKSAYMQIGRISEIIEARNDANGVKMGDPGGGLPSSLAVLQIKINGYPRTSTMSGLLEERNNLAEKIRMKKR